MTTDPPTPNPPPPDREGVMSACPWCPDDSAYVAWFLNAGYYAVVCRTCGCAGPACNTIEDAATAWNTRATPAPAPAPARDDGLSEEEWEEVDDILEIANLRGTYVGRLKALLARLRGKGAGA